MRIGFYVSGSAGRLRKILAKEDPELLAATKCVFSDDELNADLAGVLNKYNIDFVCHDHRSFPSKDRSARVSDLLADLLDAHHIDQCFCFGDRILKGRILKDYDLRIINFHPSVLPLFPGRKAIDQAIDANAFLLGNTAHFITEGIDEGPVIMQSVLMAAVFENEGYEGILDQQVYMLHQIYKWLRDQRISVIDGKVHVQGASTPRVAFFPPLEK